LKSGLKKHNINVYSELKMGPGLSWLVNGDDHQQYFRWPIWAIMTDYGRLLPKTCEDTGSGTVTRMACLQMLGEICWMWEEMQNASLPKLTFLLTYG